MTKRATQPRSDVEDIITANQSIADVSALRNTLLQRVPQPVAWMIQNRQEHLRAFASFFESILDPESQNPRLRVLVGQLARSALSRQCGWPTPDLCPTPPLDLRFNDGGDLLPLLFALIFQDQGLLRQWMHQVDAHVEASSRANLEALDEAALRGEAPVRKDVVLVGGGPLTSVVASVLGAFFHVTVVSMQRGLGKPWRNRRGIRLNSSCRVLDFNGPALPLLGGPTTRVIASQQWNSINVDVLQGTDTLTVACENGRTVEYSVGARLGDLVATDILFHADDFLVKQWVDVSRLQRNEDGSLRMTLVAEDDHTVRQLDATAVFLLTGPGLEQSKVPDDASQRFYQGASEQIDLAVRQARRDLAQELVVLGQIDTAADFPDEERVRAAVRRKRLGDIATCIARNIQRTLPRLLTLTMIEQVYDIWEELEERGADPEAFPFADLFTGQKSVAYIGSGDTARTLKEWVDGVGPACAYPSGARRGKPVRATIYNESASTPEEYARSNRPRYADVFTPTTRAISQKASRYRLTSDRRGRPRVEVTHRDADGVRRRRLYDYVFDATGLSRRPIEAQLPPSFQMVDVVDLEGFVVARGDRVGTLCIAGAATGFRGSDFPLEIQRILQVLQIGENTVSLWANGVLAERLAYTYATTRPITKTEPKA